MTFNDLEQHKIEMALAAFLAKKRPPIQIRAQLDSGYRLSGQSVELIEIRPQWGDPGTIRVIPLAKATFVTAQNDWKVFWQLRSQVARLRADAQGALAQEIPGAGRRRQVRLFLRLKARCPSLGEPSAAIRRVN